MGVVKRGVKIKLPAHEGRRLIARGLVEAV
jgi:hypothetical protein